MSPRRSVSLSPARAIRLLGLALAVFLVGYSAFVALPLLMGPSLSVSDPWEEGATVIKGETARVSFLEINGEAVSLKEDGSFEVRRAFPAGYTDLVIVARDRFGREIRKHITFITNTHGSEEKQS